MCLWAGSHDCRLPHKRRVRGCVCVPLISDGWQGKLCGATLASRRHWHPSSIIDTGVLLTARRAAAGIFCICHCHFTSVRHCSGNCMCKAKTACDQLQQGSRDVRVLETETEVLCVLLCAPARVINNCDKFFFSPIVTCESP